MLCKQISKMPRNAGAWRWLYDEMRVSYLILDYWLNDGVLRALLVTTLKSLIDEDKKKLVKLRPIDDGKRGFFNKFLCQAFSTKRQKLDDDISSESSSLN